MRHLTRDATTYQVFDTLEELHKQLPGFIFAKFLLHHNVVEKFSLWCQLEHQIDAISLIESVFEAKDVGVTDTHQNTNLLLQTLRLGAVFHTRVFRKDLDCIALTSGLLNTQVDLGKVALAELLQKSILLKKRARLAGLRIAEDKPRLAVDSDLVLFLQLATLVSADDSLVDKRSVA